MKSQEDILEGLNPAQQEAVLQTEGPVLVLAGAGSGKTKTIVHRIACLIHVREVSPRKIVAVTFTNKAAQEMAHRIYHTAGEESQQCLIRTYHSLGLYLLRQLAPSINFTSNFTIWDDTDQLGTLQKIAETLSIKRAAKAKEDGDEFERVQEKLNKTQLRYLAQTINSFKDRLLAPGDLEEKVDLEDYEFGDYLPELYKMYEARKAESQAVDFSDLIYLPVKIFQEFPETLLKFQQRFHYFLVDEYQDTNHAQYMLVTLLSSAQKNICVVGDDDQAIYTWRGADVRNILDFNRDYPEAKIIKLEQNYRSTQAILNLANGVIENNSSRMEKRLWTENEGGEKPRFFVKFTDREESNFIADTIESLVGQYRPEDIAVLYRTNAQSRLIEESLLNRRINYRVFGGVSFFGRKEVKDLLAYMRFLVNPFDEAAFLRIINNPSRGIGDKTVQKLLEHQNETAKSESLYLDYISLMKRGEEAGISKKAAATLEDLAEWLGSFRAKIEKSVDLGFLVEDILEASTLRDAIEEEDRLLGTSRMENIVELKSSMIDFMNRQEDARLSDYLQDISLIAGTKDLSGESAGVNLMTIHNAKGLEFSVVLIPGFDHDIFPHYLASDRGEGEEERRLLYVAITRARKKLYMLRSKTRFLHGAVQNTMPSIFVAEMKGEFLDFSEEGKGPGFQKPAYKNPYMRPQKPSAFANNVTTPAMSGGSAAGFKAGQAVKHPKFGSGKILRIEGSGDAAKGHIYFKDGKTRKFVLKFTPLEKI